MLGNKFWEGFREIVKDKKGIGTMALIGIVFIIMMMGGFFLLSWIILSNLETIGKGLLYISGAILVMVGVAILAKHYLFTQKTVREVR